MAAPLRGSCARAWLTGAFPGRYGASTPKGDEFSPLLAGLIASQAVKVVVSYVREIGASVAGCRPSLFCCVLAGRSRVDDEHVFA